MLNITKQAENDCLCVALEGRLDTVTSPDLEKDLQESLPEVKELVLDFEKLEYVSSAGLRVLLAAQKIMNKQGTMKVVNVCKDIMDIFDVTGFAEILTVEALDEKKAQSCDVEECEKEEEIK